jgi:hypothetical protein
MRKRASVAVYPVMVTNEVQTHASTKANVRKAIRLQLEKVGRPNASDIPDAVLSEKSRVEWSCAN